MRNLILMANLALICANGILLLSILSTSGRKSFESREVLSAPPLRSYSEAKNIRHAIKQEPNEKTKLDEIVVPFALTKRELLRFAPEILRDDLTLSEKLCDGLGISKDERHLVNEQLRRAFGEVRRKEAEAASISNAENEAPALVIEPVSFLAERNKLSMALRPIIGSQKTDQLMEILKHDKFFKDELNRRTFWIEIDESDPDGKRFSLVVERGGDNTSTHSGWITRGWAKGESNLLDGMLRGRYQHIFPNQPEWESYLKANLTENKQLETIED